MTAHTIEKREPEVREPGRLVPAMPAFTLPRLFERVEEMLEGRWAPLLPALRWPDELAAMTRLPPVDVYEEGDAVVVKAELPGMRKEEIEVTLESGLLTIAGKKEKQEKVEKKEYHRLERMAGEFRRAIALPAEVELEKVTATFKDGLLEIRAPKSEAAKAKTRRIEVA